MIRNTIIEIVIVILFVIISIPTWQFFNNNISIASQIENRFNLKLAINNQDGYDNVIVDNTYSIAKNYELILTTDQNCDDLTITINTKSYPLHTFSKIEGGSNYQYILAIDTLKASRKGYKINLNLEDPTINYYYSLIELTEI